MYAIIKTGGKQYRVASGEKVLVEKVAGDVGAEITLGEVLMLGDGDNVRIGAPMIDGVSVTAKIVGHGRGEKIRIFKMKRRKGYRRTQGHRQSYTELQITAINA